MREAFRSSRAMAPALVCSVSSVSENAKGALARTTQGLQYQLLKTSRTKWPSPKDNSKLRRELCRKLENGRSDRKNRKSWRTQDNGKSEASNKVGPQSVNMCGNKVDQITFNSSVFTHTLPYANLGLHVFHARHKPHSMFTLTGAHLPLSAFVANLLVRRALCRAVWFCTFWCHCTRCPHVGWSRRTSIRVR